MMDSLDIYERVATTWCKRKTNYTEKGYTSQTHPTSIIIIIIYFTAKKKKKKLSILSQDCERNVMWLTDEFFF
jgi:hypothetical protein